jgi:Domain of unknown function (DUF4145)
MQIEAYCNSCCGSRSHEVLHREETEWCNDSDPLFTIGGSDIYDMIRCCGCKGIALRHCKWSDWDVDKNGEPITHVTYYPPNTLRREPEWLSDLMPGKIEIFIKELLREIYVALRNDSNRLAALGIRALVEGIMIDKVEDQKSLTGNLKKFEQNGFVSASQRTVLEPVLDAGSAVMHRGFGPSREDIVHTLDIAESIIESIYVNECRANRIKKSVPARSQKKKPQQ